MGRRVAELYRAAGLVDIQVDTRAEVYPKGYTCGGLEVWTSRPC
jgi:hypothetical protein